MTTKPLTRGRRRFRRRLPPDRQEEVYGNIEALSSPVPSFYLMVAISSIIASYGLLANSTAVVIGAMLVAPLMGPIFGIALGTAAGDRRLLEMSSLAEALGVVIAVGISLLVGLMPLRVDFGSEIIGRTHPTIYDIVIALASGIAGTYALLSPRISPALPGVAIATSVVPPLATCGLCLSAGRWSWALGAFLLFVANLLAIELAAAGVLSVYGVTDARPTKVHTVAGFLRRFGLSLLLLLAAAAFMTHTLATTIGNRRFAGALEQALSEQLRASVGARLSDLSYTRQQDETEVIAVVLTPLEFTPEQIADMEASLQKRLHCRLHLVMRSLLSKDADRRGLVFLPEEQGEPASEVDEQTKFLRTASASLTKGLSRVPGARLVDMRRDTDGDQSVVTAVVRSPTAVAPHQVVDLERALQQSLDANVTLVVRSILTRDADARSYLYERETEVVDTSVPSRARVEAALKNQLRGLEPAAQLQEFRYTWRGGELLVFAAVRTPRMLKPEEVARMQQAFQRYVEPTTRLVIRSSLGADANAEYLLSGFDESKLMETP